MTFDAHVRRGHPIVFGLLILFGLVELSISAWLTARYSMKHDAPNSGIEDRANFLLFTSIWTVLFSFIYTILFWHSATGSILTSVASHIAFLVLTWIFWTSGAAAITAGLGGGLNCKLLTLPFSHAQPFNYCGQLNALEAFAWIEWILTTFALIIILVRGISSGRRGDGMRGGLVP